MFFSRTVRPCAKSYSIGSAEVSVFQERVVNGVKCLVETGKRNIRDFINAGREECDVYRILEKFNRGDEQALFRGNPQYVNVVGMPTTLAEAQQRLIDISNYFDSLPLDIRQKFDNSVDRYIHECGSLNKEALLNAGLLVQNSDSGNQSAGQGEGGVL